MLIDPTIYQQQLDEKYRRLSTLLQPFGAPEPEIFSSEPLHYRERAEFRLWRQDGTLHYAMFPQGGKSQPKLLEQFPSASRRINTLMPRIKLAWEQDRELSYRLFQAEFLTSQSGDALITLCYHRPLDDQWLTRALPVAQQLGISLIGRSRGKRLMAGRDFVHETFTVGGRSFTFEQPEGTFSQPNAGVNSHMLNWAWRHLGHRQDDLLELYCGNGNFTLPLSTRVRRVLATEINKTSVKAALANLKVNGIDNIVLARLSAEELTQALNDERTFRRLADIDLQNYRFGTVFVDPPRAGMDSNTCELVRRFERILYISCNPETLIGNLQQLYSSHYITACALFDQFPYTHHMETGVLLEKHDLQATLK